MPYLLYADLLTFMFTFLYYCIQNAVYDRIAKLLYIHGDPKNKDLQIWQGFRGKLYQQETQPKEKTYLTIKLVHQ